MFFNNAFAADPLGQLYWKTNEYPDETFLYNTTDQYNGAVASIDYACTQYAGSSGTYTNSVDMADSSINYPAEKAGYCLLQRPFFPGTFQGQLYYTYLYCNGEKRTMMNDSPCQQPLETYEPNRNFGPALCHTNQWQ